VNNLRPDEVRKILVLNRNHIGDCLLTTPLLRALKRGFPRARLEVSVPRANWALLDTNPHVDEIVPRPERLRMGAKFKFAFEMRRRDYDLIISLQEKSMFYAWSAYYIGLRSRRRPLTVGFDHPRTRRLYGQSVVPLRRDQHEVYKYLDIAAALGCPMEPNPVLELEPAPEARDFAERFLNSRGVDTEARFIGVNPGGTKEEKRWPVERFAETADRLHQELALPVIIFGGKGDIDMATQISERMSHRPLIAAGRASLGDTAALLERCHFLVTGDTGPMHMAVAMAVPVVALFGPTSTVKFGPFSTLGAVLASDSSCPNCRKPCLHQISADECVEAALKMYHARSGRPVRSERSDRNDHVDRNDRSDRSDRR
jgi:lipopolysaccharide heptosyltransferase II